MSSLFVLSLQGVEIEAQMAVALGEALAGALAVALVEEVLEALVEALVEALGTLVRPGGGWWRP